MKRLITMCAAATMILAIGSMANADWNPGDPYKMHYPQLPDPYGWDVAFTQSTAIIADDWSCTETGPVKDIHLWFSWRGDNVTKLTGLNLAIYDNNPDGPGGFSIPGNYCWNGIFPIDDSHQRLYGEGLQGWLDPTSGSYTPADHEGIYQVNITDIANPFTQQAGQIYWLIAETAWWEVGGGTAPAYPGWKTSNNGWGDNAVWWEYNPQVQNAWHELVDPLTGASLNLAFVITPEPATICLLGLGALSLLRRKRSA